MGYMGNTAPAPPIPDVPLVTDFPFPGLSLPVWPPPSTGPGTAGAEVEKGSGAPGADWNPRCVSYVQTWASHFLSELQFLSFVKWRY